MNANAISTEQILVDGIRLSPNTLFDIEPTQAVQDFAFCSPGHGALVIICCELATSPGCRPSKTMRPTSSRVQGISQPGGLSPE